MFKHYLTTAWRNLVKYRAFSLINIFGLAIGLAAFWAIALYVGDEYSYDRSLPTADRVYRAVSYLSWDGGKLETATSSPPFAAALKSILPQVQATTRVIMDGGNTVSMGDKQFDIDNLLLADSTFFTVFPYHFVEGDPKTALVPRNGIVITRSLAEKFFGSAAAAMGKTIRMGDQPPLAVTAVMEDVPVRTHLQFDAVRPWPVQDETGTWQNYNVYTYLLLKPGADRRQAEAVIARTFTPFIIAKSGGHQAYHMELQPLTSIHLRSHLQFETGRNGDIRYVYIFIAAALLILSIAVINYMNLSTARSALRVREVGVRKAIGSPRGTLVGLFLAESIIITLVAAFLGLLVLELFLPVFNHLSGKNLSLLQLGVGNIAALVFLFALLIGLAAGIYPALFLSGFGILHSLKGELGRRTGNVVLRKGLVTFQFIITIAMISASSLVYLQLRHMETADLGFNKDQTVTFHVNDPAVRRQIDALRNKLLENPLIEDVSGASNPIGSNFIGGRNFRYEKDGQRKHGSVFGKILWVDEHFLPTLQIPVVAGRNFSPGIPSDSAGGVLVNETFVHRAGWTDPIGKRVSFFIDDQGDTRDAKVVGVTRDFNIYSLQNAIQPLAIYYLQDPDDKDNLYVRLAKGHIAEALSYLETTYKTFDASGTVEYHFLDQSFSSQYDAERRQGYVFLSFTVLAVLLACLGLFGLVSFSASRRVKEIGIRKVLGAGNWGIVTLLAGDLLRLVVLAACIAGPLAWWVMDRWLQDFAYRIPVYWWVLAGAGLAAAGIALLTMITQAMKAARANPANALKYE
ncbi:ABC transporter permease [Dinghuibacter silviterrae]|uniref:Putative ABC transport system permease protein n=1 Tax=Dinghuibacter silviterrae TaxID=1539049 RepID=A0A4R8DNS6_9BACT|nr:ABC transporter permease [Dinghuibacter silviterrae]TDW99719.1 putative ABC transport system permease protein [Dinghuibacter silviterrae]